MEGRGITDILLAVIAGVLLFGRDAMTSGLQGFAVVAVAIFAIYLVLRGVGAILSWIGTEWRAAGNTEGHLGVVFATVAGCILVPLCGYVVWLWVTGAENPISTASSSWLGWAWMGLLLLLMAGYGIYGARKALRWLSGHWSEVPGIVAYRLRVFLRGYLEFLGGPVTFPIREWRIRSEAGSGTAVKLVSAAYTTVLGLVVAFMTVSLSILAAYGLFSSLGIIN
ncbi:hypothetical protein [Mesorhizobium sp. M1163]|uniref:hypothetical protein n=1 Tax=Mesorhizobium sp. M1163 TaxID=2957065 RepID=UPI00333AE9F3